MHALTREKLELVKQLLDEVLEVSTSNEGLTTARTPDFSAQCMKCGRAIRWAATENGKRAALDERPGPYVLVGSTAVFEGGTAGYAYHYDGTPDGCPAQPRRESDDDPPRREWQDIYDK
jgi:hypothetical protein